MKWTQHKGACAALHPYIWHATFCRQIIGIYHIGITSWPCIRWLTMLAFSMVAVIAHSWCSSVKQEAKRLPLLVRYVVLMHLLNSRICNNNNNGQMWFMSAIAIVHCNGADLDKKLQRSTARGRLTYRHHMWHVRRQQRLTVVRRTGTP